MTVFMLAGGTPSARASETTHDGHWWQSLETDRRLGYLAGFGDCALYDANRSEFANASWTLAEPEVSKYYAEHPAEWGNTVPAVYEKVIRKANVPESEGAEDPVPGKHGMFDGEYWRQVSDAHRIGFVEGYLDCRASTAKETLGTEDPRTYVVEVSRRFGVTDEDPGEIRDDRAEVKIADVLVEVAGVRSAKQPTDLPAPYSTRESGNESLVSEANAEIVSVRRVDLVRIRIVVRNVSGEPLLLPYCGDRGGTKLLCTLATHLQAKTKLGWAVVESAKNTGVLGGYPLEHGFRLEAGAESTFEHTFAPRLFQIEANAPLRLVLDAWGVSQSMTEKPSTRIVTDTFTHPGPG